MVSLQELIRQLTRFWEKKGCVIHQGYDLEVGAGTFNPATFLRCLGKEPYNTAYVEPSRRPSDGRFGENPNRLQLFHQFQVVLKPSPTKVQAYYLESLETIGFKLHEHDIRFVHDDWESPTLGAWGLGWEVWCDGMEVSQFTYFQGMASLPLKPVCAEITYGLERLCMFIQNVKTIFDIQWNDELKLADIAHQSELEWSTYNFSEASTEMWHRHFEDYEREAKALLAKHLPLPAYDFVLKASHAFNLLEARGVISVTERTGYIGRIRELARMIGLEYLASREKLGFPLAKETKAVVKRAKKPSKTFDANQKRDFLLEIGSEELPATFVPIGMRNLERDIKKLLDTQGLSFDRIVPYGTPRRLTVKVEGLVEGIASKTVEKRGPPLSTAKDARGQWTAQGLGFLKTVGGEKHVRVEHIKGVDYLVATVHLPGKSTAEILAEHLPALTGNLEFPKKMRWADFEVTYARPIHWIVSLFGTEVVPFVFADVVASNFSFGHAQRAHQKIVLKNADDYVPHLKDHYVIPDPEERKRVILEQIKEFEVVERDKVLSQVVFLTEWPETIVGNFEERFLEVPQEVLISEMVEHQKYFPVAKGGKLQHTFLITCDNTPTPLIRAGNEKVLSARLADGAFLYKQDAATPLEKFNEKLKQVVFQQKLGSMLDKVKRIEAISKAVSAQLSIADTKHLVRAAHLCKADLASALVREFPELQGVIGKYYALMQGEDLEVALALEEHWMPKAEGAPLPQTAIGTVVSLADKIDNLLAYYSADLKPTSSSDPYGLRRQTIGLLKIILQGKYSVDLRQLLTSCSKFFPNFQPALIDEILTFITARAKGVFEEMGCAKDEVEASLYSNNVKNREFGKEAAQIFRLEREGHAERQGASEDKKFAAKLTPPKTDSSHCLSIKGLCIDPYDQWCQVKALHAFRKTDAFKPLFEVYKRAKGQLGTSVMTPFDPAKAKESAEQHLVRALESVGKEWAMLLEQKDYATAYALLAELQPPLAHLFDTVKILADDPVLRENRLALLHKVFDFFATLLDFSRIQVC